MIAHISLKDAEGILTKHYEKEYENFTNFQINYSLQKRTESYTDWGGWSDTYTYYEIQADITFQNKIGEVVTTFEVTKSKKELTDDLTCGLRELYASEDFDISSVSLPTTEKDKLSLDAQVSIFFNKGKKLEKALKQGS